MSKTILSPIPSGGVGGGLIPRGIRNNNPLNIRRSKNQWKGM